MLQTQCSKNCHQNHRTHFIHFFQKNQRGLIYPQLYTFCLLVPHATSPFFPEQQQLFVYCESPYILDWEKGNSSSSRGGS